MPLCLFLLLVSLILCFGDFIDDIYNLTYFSSSRSPGVVKRAALLTPYGLTPGGGERYFLTSALALQKLGYAIDLILFADNICQTHNCIHDTLISLRIPLEPHSFQIRVIPKSYDFSLEIVGKSISERHYEVFYLIGNGKFPTFLPIGQFNIYMCQFPFDVNAEKAVAMFNYHHYFPNFVKFDQIIVNSRFTHNWYMRAVSTALLRHFKSEATYSPTLTILHPPVESFITDNSATEVVSPPPRSEVTNIVVCGRLFLGRQNKGHDIAIDIFKDVVAQAKTPVHLYLMGYVHPDLASHQYIQDLRHNASASNLPVSFLPNARSDEIFQTLGKSTILWHLTGVRYLEAPNEDPASFEHFGIAIVEAMYSGCIPIVTHIGGPTDIITHKHNGFLASSINEYVTHTLALLETPEAEVQRIQRNAQRTAKSFSTTIFIEKLQAITIRGVRMHALREQARLGESMLLTPTQVRCVCVCVCALRGWIQSLSHILLYICILYLCI